MDLEPDPWQPAGAAYPVTLPPAAALFDTPEARRYRRFLEQLQQAQHAQQAQQGGGSGGGEGGGDAGGDRSPAALPGGLPTLLQLTDLLGGEGCGGWGRSSGERPGLVCLWGPLQGSLPAAARAAEAAIRAAA